MKKYFKLMSLFMGLMICTPAFVACGDDDDDSPSNNQNNQNNQEQKKDQDPPATDIAGTWKISLVNDAKTWEGDVYTMKYDEEMSFNADQTFKATVKGDGGGSGNMYGGRIEGSWSKLGSDRVIVNMEKKYNFNQDGSEEADKHFTASKDTLSYFFKGNAVFCESVINNGFFAYTRSGELPYNGYGDYANSPILGVWIGEDFAWDGTPITTKYELKSNGTYALTQDNHQGWSEGMAGYYIVDNNRVMFISYYFISKMDSADDTWEVVGYRMWGGYWIDFKIDGVKLIFGEDPGSMSGEMDFLVREGKEAGSSLVGHWLSSQTLWYENPVQEDEYWEIEDNKTVRHWWIRDGKFSEGTMGTYELTAEGDNTYIVCHWNYWLADSGNNSNPKQGDETGRGESDYTLKYVYSKITDVLLVEWNPSIGLERFKRIK